MQSRIRRMHACLAVTCHLHFWHNHRDLMRATAVVRGWNGSGNKPAQKVDPGEINSPDIPGFEPATVNGITHLAREQIQDTKNTNSTFSVNVLCSYNILSRLWFCGSAHDFKYITFFISSFCRISSSSFFPSPANKETAWKKLLKGDGTPHSSPPPSLPPRPILFFFFFFSSFFFFFLIDRNCRRTGSFCSFIKGITPTVRRLCFVLINGVILNLLSAWTGC